MNTNFDDTIRGMLSPVGNMLCDFENFDWQEGRILGRKPTRRERPSLERKRAFVNETFGTDWRIFEFCQRKFDTPALRKYAACAAEHGIEVIFAEDFLTDAEIKAGTQVVDSAIKKFLTVSNEMNCGIAVVSHDRTYAPQLLEMLLEQRDRRIAVIGFKELFHDVYTSIIRHGLEIFDAEGDCGFFEHILPRRIKNMVWSHRNGGPVVNPIITSEAEEGVRKALRDREMAAARDALIRALTNLAQRTGSSVFPATTVKLQMLTVLPKFSEKRLGFARFSVFLGSHTDVVHFLANDSGGLVIVPRAHQPLHNRHAA